MCLESEALNEVNCGIGVLSLKKNETLESIWRDVLLPIVGQDNFDRDRLRTAITFIVASINTNRMDLTDLERAYDIGLINSVWQLICNDVMHGYLDMIEPAVDEYMMSLDSNQLCLDQVRLRTYFAAALRCMEETDRDGLDMISITLPTKLADMVLDGLEGLEAGEQCNLFKPQTKGRHLHPHSWDEARLLACQHVNFLVGKGAKKQDAQREVAAETLIKVETLRAWERELKKGVQAALALLAAHDAGALAAQRRYESLLTRKSLLASQKKLDGTALAEFAQYYRSHFGSRHWQR